MRHLTEEFSAARHAGGGHLVSVERDGGGRVRGAGREAGDPASPVTLTF